MAAGGRLGVESYEREWVAGGEIHSEGGKREELGLFQDILPLPKRGPVW